METVPAAGNEVLQSPWRTPQQRFRQYDRTEATREMRSQMCRRSRSARCIFLRQRVRKCCKGHSPDQIRDQKGAGLPGDRNSSGPATDQTSDKSTSSYCKHKGDSLLWSEFFAKNKAGQDHDEAAGVEQSACDGQCAQGDAEKIAYVEERDAGNAGSQEHPQISQVDPKKESDLCAG